MQTKYIISFDKLVNNDKNEIKLIEKEENISQDNLSTLLSIYLLLLSILSIYLSTLLSIYRCIIYLFILLSKYLY